MRLLAFDTAQGALSAALLDGDEIRAHRLEMRTRGHAEALMPMLAALMEDAGLGFADLDALAVSIGPGTFTGLRAGLAAARGMALARGLPLVGVTTLEAIAAPVIAAPDEIIAACFDARRDEVYFQLFDAGLNPLSEPEILNLASAREKLEGRKSVVVGTGAKLLGDCAQMRFAEASPQPDALHLARIAQARIARSGPDSFRSSPAPLYLRQPDAKLPGGLSLSDLEPGPESQ